MKSSLKILIAHQKWRRGGNRADYTSTDLSDAIDDAIEALKERDIARRVGVQQIGEIIRLRNAMDKATRLK